MSDLKKVTLADLDRFLDLPSEAGPQAEPVEHAVQLAYTQAAAVLAAFNPYTIHAFGLSAQDKTGVGADCLLPLSEPISQGSERGLWSLMLPHRRAALRSLGSRENIRAALATNPNVPPSHVQDMFQRMLDTAPMNLSLLKRDELSAALSVCEWTTGILPDLPNVDEVRHALSQCDLFAPMHRLTDVGFVGRTNELHRLEEFVTSAFPPYPLFVFGSGGVGKSTLLARFILTSLVPRGAPVAYLDLDRPTVRPQVPLTLLLEIVSQFRAQLEMPAIDSLTKEITYAMSRFEDGRYLESSGGFYSRIVRQLGALVAPHLKGQLAVVIVDTMEEAQFLGHDVMWPLMDFLWEMGGGLPDFRFILAGRALPSEYLSRLIPQMTVSSDDEIMRTLESDQLPFRPVNLTVLDEESAALLLTTSLQAEGVSPLEPQEIEEIVAIVSRNPMCLKLAARLLRDEGVEKFRAERTEFLAKLRVEKIQAALYGRILRHIHGDAVRKLAYPGLVVRRITPEVILTVLAEPCELALSATQNEHTLFQELEKEAALVYRDSKDGSLRHRVDVRRVMLADLLDQVAPSVVEAIDKNAIAFYEPKPGAADRAEEIYHRLRLKQPQETLEERWKPEAAEFLKGAIEEVGSQQALWLAEKLGVTLDSSVRKTANQEAWEEQAERSVERFLSHRLGKDALAVLEERPERLPRSRLFALHAEALRFVGNPDEALRVARLGVESASKAGAIDMVLDLLLKMVLIEETRGNLDAAACLLKESAGVATHSSNEIQQFRVKITGLRLQRQIAPADSAEKRALRDEALHTLTDEMLRQLKAFPVLLREAAAELGKQDRRLVSLAIETLGLEVGSDQQAEALGRALDELTKAADQDIHPELAATAKEFELSNFEPAVIRKHVTDAFTSIDTGRISSTVARSSGGSVLDKFRRYFRVGVDISLKGGGDLF